MSHPILAIGKNIEVFHREQSGWEKVGISMILVDGMRQAMDELSRGTFLFIAISADSIDYLPMLPIMREATIAPIFIVTSKFSIRDQLVAIHNGADVYAPFLGNSEANVMFALTFIYWRNGLIKRSHGLEEANNGILAIGNILVMESHYRVFISGKEIHLTPTEYKILLLLMKNRRRIFTYNALLREAWGEEYEDSSHNLVWHQVKKLKRKLRTGLNELEYIVNIHGVGYRFDP